MSLTDKQIEWLFRERLSHHNAFRCGLTTPGRVPTVCAGRAVIRDGRVNLLNTCGEPCTYVCENTGRLAQEVERVQAYDRLILEAKEKA